MKIVKDDRRNRTTAVGHSVDDDKIVLCNKLHWEDGLSFYKISGQHKISRPVIERIVFTTRTQWTSYKQDRGIE
jgi:hypothetical protein